MLNPDQEHTQDVVQSTQPRIGRYLVLFALLFLVLAALNTFVFSSNVMSLVSPFLAAYLTGLMLTKKTHQLSTPSQNKALRRGATAIYTLCLLLSLVSTLIVTASVTGTPVFESISTGLLINILLSLVVGYLMIALGFWLAHLISKRLMA